MVPVEERRTAGVAGVTWRAIVTVRPAVSATSQTGVFDTESDVAACPEAGADAGAG